MEEFMKSPFAIIGSTLCLIAAAFFVYCNNKKKNKDKRDITLRKMKMAERMNI